MRITIEIDDGKDVKVTKIEEREQGAARRNGRTDAGRSREIRNSFGHSELLRISGRKRIDTVEVDCGEMQSKKGT